MSIDRKKIGERLAVLRGSRTQKEVADAIGVSPATISMYEAGERMPTDDIKIRLAKYYKRSVVTIFFAD